MKEGNKRRIESSTSESRVAKDGIAQGMGRRISEPGGIMSKLEKECD